MTRYASIIGTGSYLPENTLTNEDLERMVDTSDEWIVTRTGIKERRLAETHHGTSDLAFEAGARALACAGVAAQDVDLLVVGTSTPDGTGAELLKIPAGGSALPCTVERIENREHYVHMNGNDVFKFAVRMIPKATIKALEATGNSVSDLAWLIPHQANKRILDTIEERLGIDDERVYSNVENTGNTSAASIPLALDDLYTSGRLQPGDLIGLVGFGAGLTWGAATVRWTMTVPNKGDQ